jgi:hypothetical protein
MQTAEKLTFLQTTYIANLQSLDAATPARFGKMDVQQMIEHMAYAFRVANGNIPVEQLTPAEKIERMQTWLMTDAEFKENTPNQLLPDDPIPYITANKDEAIAMLKSEIADFVKVYAADENLRIQNAFFGMLNFDMQVQLLHKHAIHHLKQFNAA